MSQWNRMVQPTPTASPSTQARIGFGNVASVRNMSVTAAISLLVLGGVEELGKVAAEAEAAGQAAQHDDAHLVIDGGFMEGLGQAFIGSSVQHRPAVIRRHGDDQRVVAQFGLRMRRS